MRLSIAAVGIVCTTWCGALLAADFRLEPLADAVAAEELSPAIAKTLQSEGFKVIKGKSRTLCELWFSETWAAKSGFKPTNTVLYPFEVGQLVGVARYKSKGTDFRGQEIPAGVYTIRYAQQPVDGNHVGTSDTLDFLLLLPADADKERQTARSQSDVQNERQGCRHQAPHDVGPPLAQDRRRKGNHLAA